MSQTRSSTNKSPRQEEESEIVSRYLAPGYSAASDIASQDVGGGDGASSPTNNISVEEDTSSLSLQGGDIHRELYRIDARAKLPPRAATFSQPKPSKDTDTRLPGPQLTAAEQRAPGGFRRQYMLQRRPSTFSQIAAPMTKSFVDFLDLYGSFAGEDLAETDTESDDSSYADEEESQRRRDDPDSQRGSGERRPLLRRRKSTKREARPGDAGLTKSFFTLLKAFIGTGIMFLPKAFNNGGLLFSSIILISVAIVSCACFRLLLRCRARYGGGYGELGEAIGGSKLRTLILASITLSQLGFVCASLIFVAENIHSFIVALSNGPNPLSTNSMIAIQLLLLIPLALIRNISKLGPAALMADICIGVGLAYIYYYDISALATQGLSDTVVLFNPAAYTLTIGSSIFTYEGIGLLLPIQSSMKRPEKFGLLLYIVIFIITIVFAAVGALSYATFGADTRTEIISNYPQGSKLVNAVQFIYSFAVLVGTPVQLFPAVRIIEGKIFGRYSGKRDSLTKWKKNALRLMIVVMTGVISALGASDLDKFVALIGSFACVPLVYIYPALLHYMGVARSRAVKAGDATMMVVGLVAMVYTTVITVSQWIRG